MPRRTTQPSVVQSVILALALLLFVIAAVIAVRRMSHGPADSADDASRSLVVGRSDSAQQGAPGPRASPERP
jgi:hypothetical protein